MPANVTNGKEFEKAASKDIDEQIDGFADSLLSEFFLGIGDKLPVEDGHAHEAFRAAGDSVARGMKEHKRLRQSLGRFAANSSGDKEATKRGLGVYTRTNNGVHADIRIDLPFVRKLEYGFTIRVGDLAGNQGEKYPGVEPGTLYGPRMSGKGGLLQWREGGQIKRARTRKPPAHGFFRHAISRVKKRAKGA